MFLKKEKGRQTMEAEKPQKTCEQRIEEELKGRLAEFFPDVNTWSVLKCARHLKSAGRLIRTADVGELRDQVAELIRDQAVESLLSVEKITTYRLCLSW